MEDRVVLYKCGYSVRDKSILQSDERYGSYTTVHTCAVVIARSGTVAWLEWESQINFTYYSVN